MKYRLVQCVEGQLMASEFSEDGVVAAMEARGFLFQGQNRNPRQRAELHDQPVFSGVVGPMFDGDAIRYEDREAYARLSA